MGASWFDSLTGPVAGLTDLLLPWRCAGCGGPGGGWCDSCAGEIGGIRRARRPLLDPALPVYALGRYRGAARRALIAYKEGGRRDLAAPLGARIADGLRSIRTEHPDAMPAGSVCALVPAPSRRSASRRRGGAHMARVGRHAARAHSDVGPGAQLVDCLAMRRGVRDSVGLAPLERQQNLAGQLHVRSGGMPTPRARVVVIDDVLTTGATLAACVRALESAGHQVAAALVLTATATPSAPVVVRGCAR